MCIFPWKVLVVKLSFLPYYLQLMSFNWWILSQKLYSWKVTFVCWWYVTNTNVVTVSNMEFFRWAVLNTQCSYRKYRHSRHAARPIKWVELLCCDCDYMCSVSVRHFIEKASFGCGSWKHVIHMEGCRYAKRKNTLKIQLPRSIITSSWF